MAITQADAILAVRARLDEPVSVYWTDDDLRRWINDGCKDMARRTESLRASYDETAVVGQNDYTPVWTATQQPYRIYQVTFVTSDGMTYPMEYLDRNVLTTALGVMQNNYEGMPAFWTSWGTPPTLNITVQPSPAQAGVLRIWYFRLPAALAIYDTTDQNTNLDIVEGWEDALVDYVEYQAKRRDGDSTWTEAKQLYEQHLEAEMESTLRFADAAGQIITPGGIGMPAWLVGDGYDYF